MLSSQNRGNKKTKQKANRKQLETAVESVERRRTEASFCGLVPLVKLMLPKVPTFIALDLERYLVQCHCLSRWQSVQLTQLVQEECWCKVLHAPECGEGPCSSLQSAVIYQNE